MTGLGPSLTYTPIFYACHFFVLRLDLDCNRYRFTRHFVPQITIMARTKTTPRRVPHFSCVVCFQESPVKQAATLECHAESVCKPCLRTWFNENHSCPICRAPVTDHAAINGSAADYERAQRRQERRRERVRLAQIEYDTRVARALQMRELRGLHALIRHARAVPVPVHLPEPDDDREPRVFQFILP